MQPPVKGKVAMGLDPGYRTGCKTAVVDGTGQDEVRTARFSASAALPLTGKNDSYEFVVDGEGYDINGVEVQE